MKVTSSDFRFLSSLHRTYLPTYLLIDCSCIIIGMQRMQESKTRTIGSMRYDFSDVIAEACFDPKIPLCRNIGYPNYQYAK